MKKLLSVALAAACVLASGCAKEIKKIDYDKYKSSETVNDSVDYTYYNLIGESLIVLEQTDAEAYYFDANVKALADTKKYAVINYLTQEIGDFVAFNYTLIDGENAVLESGHVAYADDNDSMPENAVTFMALKNGDNYYSYRPANGEWIERTKSSYFTNIEVYETGKVTAQYNVSSANGEVELLMETVEYGDGKVACMFFDSDGNLVAEGGYKDGVVKISKTAQILECDEERLNGYIDAATK